MRALRQAVHNADLGSPGEDADSAFRTEHTTSSYRTSLSPALAGPQHDKGTLSRMLPGSLTTQVQQLMQVAGKPCEVV